MIYANLNRTPKLHLVLYNVNGADFEYLAVDSIFLSRSFEVDLLLLAHNYNLNLEIANMVNIQFTWLDWNEQTNNKIHDSAANNRPNTLSR